MKKGVYIATITLGIILFNTCSPSVLRHTENFEIDQVSSSVPSVDAQVIKVHLTNGNLIVFNTWSIDENNHSISGRGSSYTPARKLIRADHSVSLSLDQCVLVETTSLEGYNLISPLLMTLTIFTSAITVPCIGDPKACFGSCPTFYLEQDDSLIIQAEGFSSSITKSMEEDDVDYLRAYNKLSDSDTVKIRLMNEAYETHYIRKANLIAIPGSYEDNVYYDKEHYYLGSEPRPPLCATNDQQKEVGAELSYVDRDEYLSKTDSLDLTQKETIILSYDQFNGLSSGVVITQRQSLLTTYLFYSGMAQMGSQLGSIITAYENTSPLVRNAKDDIYKILGEVEVSVLIGERWKSIGTIHEQGPIVSDTHLIPINIDADISKVKLSMTRGLWQIDQVGVIDIYDQVEPIALQPSQLLKDGINQEQLLAQLNSKEEFLVNNPGASYTLVYKLPEAGFYSLFINTKGYYTEWMRSEWLAEEDIEMSRILIQQPKKWLRIMSPGYKNVESEMNELFWQSKFGYNE